MGVSNDNLGVSKEKFGLSNEIVVVVGFYKAETDHSSNGRFQGLESVRAPQLLKSINL